MEIMPPLNPNLNPKPVVEVVGGNQNVLTLLLERVFWYRSKNTHAHTHSEFRFVHYKVFHSD